MSAPPAEPTGAPAPDAGISDAGPPLPADFRAHMTRVVGRQLSRGHAERFEGVVWANDVARAAWASAGAMPDGAMLVEELFDQDHLRQDRSAADDRTAGLLVMRKSAGSWRFVSIGPAGEVVDDAAHVARCVACHRQATSDFVFRPPGSRALPAVGAPSASPQVTSTATSAPMTARAPTAVATTAATYEARSAGPAASPSSR